MKAFLFNSKNIEKDGLVWNMIGSMLMSFQSVIFLMVLSRTVGLVESGIFTIAFANANLFLYIGKYCMRCYQASDVSNRFSFSEYKCSRWITWCIMILVSLIHTSYMMHLNSYSFRKTQIIIWMCLFKSIDAIEDVYFGEYQKKGRLDIAAKMMSLRMFITIVLFVFLIIFTKDLLATVVVSTIVTAAVEVIIIRWVNEGVIETHGIRFGRVKLLLLDCLPLASSSFCSFYVLNAPKYAIDAQLSDEMQACYGFISMPLFVITMLSNFIFTPVIYKMSCLWNEKNVKEFVGKLCNQTIIIIGITIVCLIGANFWGIPVLSLLYDTDLSLYKIHLLVLLIGGGFVAWSSILSAAITIIRYQKMMLLCYVVMAMIAFFLSDLIVNKYQLMGAAVLYTILTILLCVFFILILFIGIRKAIKYKE